MLQQQVVGWQDVAMNWGSLCVVCGQEDVSHEVFILAQGEFDVLTGMRLVKGERKFLIMEVQRLDEGDRWDVLRVQEILKL